MAAKKPSTIERDAIASTTWTDTECVVLMDDAEYDLDGTLTKDPTRYVLPVDEAVALFAEKSK